MKRPGQYFRHGRLQGQHAAGAIAIKVYSCDQCEAQYRADQQPQGAKPAQCLACGCMAFITFPSITEAKQWAKLRLQERVGLISDLRRQVPLKLFAWTPAGQPYEVAAAVLDFSFIENGELVMADAKPKSGVDDLANLKFKIAAANGTPIRILTS